jgi:nitroreductase
MLTDTLASLPSAEDYSSQSGIHPLIAQRRTRRAFSSRLVEPETLRTLLEAARWAPSSMNEQPWRFIIARREKPPEFERLLQCLLEFNIRWAQHAPVLMLAIAKLSFTATGEGNRHALYDVGQAMAALTYQASAFSLTVSQMAGFDVQKARGLYSIPSDYEPVVAAAIGYHGDPAILPAKLQQKELAPRRRNSTEGFAFESEWGRPADWGNQAGVAASSVHEGDF